MNRREIYFEILYRGLLDIRANCDDPKRVSAQSDHLHNIPGLLANFDDENRHDYYWNLMRPAYIKNCNPARAGMFDDLWEQLADLRAGAGSDRSA